MPPTTTTESAPRKYGGKSKWDLRALGVSTKASRKSKAGGTKPVTVDAKPGATKASSSIKASNSTKASNAISTNAETIDKNINKETVNMSITNADGKGQDREVMEMFRKFEEAQAAEAQAAGEVDSCSEASTVSESTTVFGSCEPSNTSGVSERSNAFGSPEPTNALAIPEPFNIFDDKPSFDFGVADSSNVFGLRESPDIFDDNPSFNFATTSSGELVLLDSQGSKVSVLGTYSMPAKDRLPTFEGEVAFFQDWTQEQLDEEQHAPMNDRKAARLRLRRKRYDFVGGPGYRVYLARRERRLTEDEDDFLPRKRMHTTQDLAHMRAKWRVRRERPLRDRAMRRCLRERAVKYGQGRDADKARKGGREVSKVEGEDGEQGWKVLLRLEADGRMGDDGCQVDEVYAVGGEEQAVGEEDQPMGAEDQPMDIDQAGDEEENDDDDADAPRVPFRRESTPEPEGEEDWVV